MRTKYLLTITSLLGLSLISILPSYSYPSNQCKSAPLVAPSNETRQIRVERYGIAFSIPENYRTSSYITDSVMVISIYNPSTFEYNECLKNNKVPTETSEESALLEIFPVSSGNSLIDIARQSRNRRNFRYTTFKNEPAIGIEGISSFGYSYDAVLFFLPNQKFSVTISNHNDNRDNKALGENIKSSFTFINR
jgi:hypothetical protein